MSARAGRPLAMARRALRRVSGATLFLGLLGISTLVALGLSAAVVAEAVRSNHVFTEAIGARVLDTLERDALSGLVRQIDDYEGALVPGGSDVEFAVWRLVGGERRLLRETRPGLAALLSGTPGGALMQDATGQRYAVHAPDVAAASAGWDMQVRDVAVRFAVAQPTPRTLAARRTLFAVWSGFGLAVALGLALHLDHRRRYRAGLDRINAVLGAFSAGDTSARVQEAPQAPELRRLTDHLGEVLPRFDRLLGDLRALTAHLAHELKTPLQTIRTDVWRLSESETREDRQAAAREIDRTIDLTDARLRSVMQLFRLSAEAHVPMQPGVALDEIVTDQTYDLEDFLVDRGRELVLDVEAGLRVTANPPLLELLVFNLLSNAGKYAPEGAVITVSARRSDGGFELRVSNTGSAFPEAWVDRPFRRLARGGDHGNVPGHGLGLALVETIAARHGFGTRMRNGTDAAIGARTASYILHGPCDAAP